jgi:hypothetical protein
MENGFGEAPMAGGRHQAAGRPTGEHRRDSSCASAPPQEYCELMSALHPFEDDDWDRQMKVDDASGKFAAMNEKAGREYAAGRTRPLSDIIEAIKG